MTTKNVVVTGANRGIGLEFVRQLLARGDCVDATVRDLGRATALRDLASHHGNSLRLWTCDVGRDASVRTFAEARVGRPVDVLINNAGVMGQGRAPLDELDFDDLASTLNVNAVGPLRVVRALLSALKSGADRKVVHVSSAMGSISDNGSGGAYAYRMSKAALNMASKNLSLALTKEKVISVVVHPGWVQTEMGGAGALLTPQESVKGLLAVIDQLTPEQNGSFLDYRGKTLGW